ncbi:MAG TPA: DUF3467 domain-containing protein [Thermoguttaceae bacterium]|nr:DUF3467 domain-containing protein [Thermoguttaceae bacterium]
MGFFGRLSRRRKSVAEVVFDDARVSTTYPDWVAFTAMREACMIDFVLLAHEPARDRQYATVLYRAAMTGYTAKQLLTALQTAIQRCEQQFGKIQGHAGRLPQAGEIAVTGEPPDPMYVNCARVTPTPEGVVMDFAFNFASAFVSGKVRILHRVVVGFYLAETLVQRMLSEIRDHEFRFGEIEIDV